MQGVYKTNIKAFDLKIIEAAIEIQIEDTKNSHPSAIPPFKTKYAEWSWWTSYLDNELSTYITSFPETISEKVINIQVSKLTGIVVNPVT